MFRCLATATRPASDNADCCIGTRLPTVRLMAIAAVQNNWKDDTLQLYVIRASVITTITISSTHGLTHVTTDLISFQRTV
jgi:hypothetical protein